MSTARTASKSKELLRAHGLYRDPVNVVALADQMGIAVHYEPLDNNYSAFLVIKNGKASAFINAEHHPNRQRFSLAHEIGHYVLHHSKSNPDHLFLDKSLMLYTRKDASPSETVDYEMEREANRFAAELLMPEELLRKHIAKHDLDITDEFDIYRLALAFEVSEQALQIRLGRLKLATPNF